MEELKCAREDWNKATAISSKFHNFLGHLGDIVNKAQLYDESTSQPGTLSGPKIIWCMVDYSTKIKKLLKEMRTLLQLVGKQPEPTPAMQQPTPEPTGKQPPAPSTIPVAQPEELTPPTERPDPMLQEAIPDINTEDITSLEQWVAGGLQDMATPTTGSQGTTIPGSRSTPRFIRQDVRRRAEERTKGRAKELASKSKSSSEEEEYEDPITISFEEDEGMETPSQSNPIDGSELPPFEIHQPTTRSMPRRPIARPQRKATKKKLKCPSSSARKKRRG